MVQYKLNPCNTKRTLKSVFIKFSIVPCIHCNILVYVLIAKLAWGFGQIKLSFLRNQIENVEIILWIIIYIAVASNNIEIDHSCRCIHTYVGIWIFLYGVYIYSISTWTKRLFCILKFCWLRYRHKYVFILAFVHIELTLAIMKCIFGITCYRLTVTNLE